MCLPSQLKFNVYDLQRESASTAARRVLLVIAATINYIN